jgi:class 3 adenylate cyclase/tetratricopeptide (TPR) repeat protein
MQCPNCKDENTVDAKFCDQCGTLLRAACIYCGSELSALAKFCAQCGRAVRAAPEAVRLTKGYAPQRLNEKISCARAALEGERKQVTVLFADIKGSMDVFADRDPEAAQRLFDPVLERMIEAVHHYEGTVNRVMGDGILALFGAPVAHEDHAVRACYAALRMQEGIVSYADEIRRSDGVSVAIRVGVNSGEIVVCAIGNNLHLDYTIVGQTANIAARLEQMAKPGSVVTTHDTFQLAEGYVAMKSLGPMSVKGLPEPIQIYEVFGAGDARNHVQLAATRGLTQFTGRDLELEQLRRVTQLAQGGRGQVVAIVGEAGVGKSRLVHEFIHSQHAADCLVLETNSVSYGRATPYLPVIEFLRNYFGITIHQNTKLIRERVTRKVLALDASLQDSIPPLLDLLDLLDDDDPFRSVELSQHRRYTYQAVVSLLLSASRKQPVLAVFEDLHWTDSLSSGLLDELVIGARESRLVLMVSYRPEFADDWKHQPNYQQFRLEPLSSNSLVEFLQALLGLDASLVALKSFLVERTSGNPFFAEEIVRSLVDAGVLEGSRGKYRLARPFSSTEVPPTVRSVLAARIDALAPADKHLLEMSAVIGHNVPFTLLHAICGLPEDELRRILDALQSADLLYMTQLFPDLEFTFKHSLTHDVTYKGVLHERCREIHTRVVSAIEELYRDRLSEQVERLAHHAARGEVKDKAVLYLREAGKKAAARSALSDARACFEQALNVLKSLPASSTVMEQAFETRLELRPVLRQLGESREMLQHLREAEAISGLLKDHLRHGQVCAFMTTVLSTFDELDEALVMGMRALESAQRLGNLRLRIICSSYLEQVHYYRGEYDNVVDDTIDNLAALPADWVHEYFDMAVPASIFSRTYLIMSLAELGRFSEATKYDEEGIELAASSQHAHTIGFAQFAGCMLHLLKGQWAEAHLSVEQWITTCLRVQTPSLLPWAVASSSWSLARIGDAGLAFNRVREAEELLERQAAREIGQHRSWAYTALGHACLLLGRVDEARRLGQRSIEFSQRQPGFAAHALQLLGDINTHPDRFNAESGTAYYRKAMTLAELHRMRPLIAHCHRGLANVYLRTGNQDGALEHLNTATTMYAGMGMEFWLQQAHELEQARSESA